MIAMKRTVLVVDDHPQVCELIGTALREFGYEAVCAFDADEALRALHAEPPPDLALIDVALAAADGRSVAAQAERLGVATLLMTGCPDALQELAARGIDHLKKPFRLHEMESRVADRLAAAAQPFGRAGAR
jgi:DNA-binding response OmpR family regulator